MTNKNSKILFMVVLCLVPIIFFAAVELVIRIIGPDLKVKKSKDFKIAVPEWTESADNFSLNEISPSQN